MDPMGKRFYVSTQFAGVHQFWYVSNVNSSQIGSTFEEFEGTRLWNMIKFNQIEGHKTSQGCY